MGCPSASNSSALAELKESSSLAKLVAGGREASIVNASLVDLRYGASFPGLQPWTPTCFPQEYHKGWISSARSKRVSQSSRG